MSSAPLRIPLQTPDSQRCSLLICLFICAAVVVHAEDLNPVVSAWLNTQTNIQSWSADFVQTRTLKTLTQPIKETGHVWFASPNRFRWELGHPAKTIAVRAPQNLLVIYPKLKRVEKFPLAGTETGPWRDALSLLEAGFPRNQDELRAQFNIQSQSVTGNSCEVTLQPKSAAARRMIPQIKIKFDTKDFSLRANELQFADGSLMRNDFTNPVLNSEVNAKMFSPELPGDYKVVEPLKKR